MNSAGMVCVLTAFMPVRTVWNLNEAVDEAKKHEPLDFDALIPRMAEICRKALRELPRALVVIPLLFLVEWMQAGTLNSIPMAVVYALLILMDFLLFRRFLTLLQTPFQRKSERRRVQHQTAIRFSGAGNRPMISAPSRTAPGTL